MAESSVAEAWVTVRPDGSNFGSSLGGVIKGAAGTALKAGGVIGAAALAGVTAAFKVGSTFDDAFDTIRVGTGATGKALEGLKDDFRAVASEVPASMADVGTAIADLNTRLGLTGKPLETLSGQFLNLSRLTKSDVATNIQTVTRAFGDWEVKTGDQSDALDKFFRAAQSSGATVDQLAQQVVQFGAPLRQVGFTLDEATAMFASFEKAGVNTSTMMPGLKMAMKTFFEKGIDPKKGLTAAFKGIQDGSIDASEAIKIFGTRAGGDMIEAVKQGRFELDDMTKALVNGSDTITKASRDTEDFAEKWTRFKNNVLLAVEPIATRVFDGIGNAMGRLTDAFDEGGMSAVVSEIGAMLSEVGPVIVDTLQSWGRAFVEWVTPYIPVMLAKAGELLAALGEWIVTTALPWLGDKLVEWGTAFGTWVIDAAPGMFQALLDLLSQLGAWIVDHAPDIATKLGEWAGKLVVWVVDAIPKLIENLGKMLEALVGWITGTGTKTVGDEAEDGLGQAFVDGLEKGIGKRMPDLQRKIKAMLEAALRGALGLRGQGQMFPEDELEDYIDRQKGGSGGAGGGRSFVPDTLPNNIALRSAAGTTINITTLGQDSPRLTASEQILALQREAYTGGLQW